VILVPWSIPDAVRQDSRVTYFTPPRPTAASPAPPAPAEATIYGWEPPPRRRSQLLQRLLPLQLLPAVRCTETVRFLFITGMGGIRNRCVPVT
jgi:hypothetical protein